MKRGLWMAVLVAVLATWASLAEPNGMVLRGVHVVHVDALRIAKDQAIWVVGERIQAVMPDDRVKQTVPKGTVEVDLAGQYVLPGLIDSHVHHATDPERRDRVDRVIPYYRHYLQYGVTTVRDMGGDARVLMGYQRAALLGQIMAPDIHHSAIIAGPEFFTDPRTISSSKGHASGTVPWIKAITTDTDWLAVANQAKGAGATGIKIYRNLPPELLQPMADAAKSVGLQVWSHTFIEAAGPVDAILAGVEVMSHADGLSGVSKSAVKQWYEAGGRDWQDLLDESQIENTLKQMHAKQAMLDATLIIFERLGQDSGFNAVRYELAKHMTRLAHERGIRIVAGTDFTVQDLERDHPRLYDELQLMVNAVGMSPLAAIQAATWHGALALGQEAEIGLVKPGYLANLMVLKDNPASDIKALDSLQHVIKRGQFVYRGLPPGVPFSEAREAAGQLWISGQIGHYPGTKVLAGDDVKTQMHQIMSNLKQLLQTRDLVLDDLVKCSLMLADMTDWQAASDVYRSYFVNALPARDAMGASGLALGAKVELSCVANLGG